MARLSLNRSQIASLAYETERARLATLLGIGLYICVTSFMLVLGQVNADEAWYLNAGRLVMQGQLPFRDFAFTQMPLLLYVYGPLQAIQPSLLAGRLVSAMLSFGALLMAIVVARRYGGERAAAITALLLAAFTFGVYFNTIVKTYALVSFFFSATLFVLSSDLPDGRRYGLALAFAFAAALTRITAIFFAIPIFLYVLHAAPPRARLLALAEAALAGLVGLAFLSPDWTAAQWGLLNSHLNHWSDWSVVEQIQDIFATRLPGLVQSYGSFLVLAGGAIAFLFSFGHKRRGGRDLRPLSFVVAGLVLFAGSHLANGLFQLEYLVPAATAFMPILAVAVARLYDLTEAPLRAFMRGALIALALLLVLGESNQHLHWMQGRLPLSEVEAAAAYVDANTLPTDRILVFEPFYVAYVADRPTLPGMTLAQFSLQDVDTATAQRLHVVNYQMMADAIRSKAARVVIITDEDWWDLTELNPSDRDALYQDLNKNYMQVLYVDEFGQFARTLHVYLSR